MWGVVELTVVVLRVVRCVRFAMVFGLGLTASSPALADGDDGAIYGGVRAIGSVAEFGDVNITGFTGTELVENDSDVVAGVAAVLGYSFGEFPVRVEVEVGYRFRFDFDVKDVASPVVDYKMNVATTSALATAIVEWRNETNLTPFAGVTAGWARNSTDTRRKDNNNGATTNADRDLDNFAYGGVLGLGWGFRENWSVEIAYRFINLGEVETGVIDTTDRISANDYISHDLLFSILHRY
jgi:opacity protein-like surface antigen